MADLWIGSDGWAWSEPRGMTDTPLPPSTEREPIGVMHAVHADGTSLCGLTGLVVFDKLPWRGIGPGGIDTVCRDCRALAT